MLPEFDYIVPPNLSEACHFLKDHGARTKIIAGGTDLVLSLRRGEVRPRFLLDISALKELRQIEEAPNEIRIGAACTHTQIAESSLLKSHGGILSEASSRVANRQIRSLGTVGGNIANASPAADTLPALMVLNARVVVVSENGRRILSLPEIVKGPYQAHLRPEEVIASIIVDKLPERAGYHFFRIMRRKAMATARINGALVLWRRDPEGPIEEVRISVGSVTPVPCRMTDAENLLRGTLPSDRLIEQACASARETVVASCGVRKSAEYKLPVVQALVRRAIQDALAGR